MIVTVKYEDVDAIDIVYGLVRAEDIVIAEEIDGVVEAVVVARPCQCLSLPNKLGVTDVYVYHSPKASKDFYRECENRLKSYGYQFIVIHEPFDERFNARDRLVKAQGFKELTKEYVKEL